MKLQANVLFGNRGQVGNSRSKSVSGLIVLSKKPASPDVNQGRQDPKVFLTVFTMKHRSGLKFTVRGNIQETRKRFANEGKCTFSFIEPAKDLYISNADTVQLKSFLNIIERVRIAKTDKDLDSIKLSEAAFKPVRIDEVTKPSDKLIITDRKNYPKIEKTLNFPNFSILTQVTVNGCGLTRIEARILKLSNLVLLDLSDNAIDKLPESFDKLLNLKELVLRGNKLIRPPIGIFKSSVLGANLRLLDLSQNRICILTDDVSNLTKLVTLNLADNRLRRVATTLDKMSHLKHLDLSGNPFRTLPGSFARLRLDKLALSTPALAPAEDDNGPMYCSSDYTRRVPTLFDITLRLCDKAGLRQKVNQSDVPASILKTWDIAQKCYCDTMIHMSAFARGITKANTNKITASFVCNATIRNATIRCETYFCSSKCMMPYRSQKPLNYR